MDRMEATFSRSRFNRMAAVILAMTTGGELVYSVAWGLWFYPAGNVTAKLAWTMTCGVAMGAVILLAIMLLVEGRLTGGRAFVAAALFPFAILSACAVLCARIDANFNYFGGADSQFAFIVAGVIPAAVAGLVLATAFYRDG